MKRFPVMALLLAVATLGTACGAQGGTSASAWATVDGHAITQQDVQARVNLVKLLNPQSASTLGQRSTWVNETQELVAEYLVQEAAAKAKFHLTKTQETQAKSQIMGYLTQTYGSNTSLDKEITKDKTSVKDLQAFAIQATLLSDYLKKVVTAPPVTESAVSKFYATNIKQFEQPQEYDLAHILVKTKAQAQTILQQLQAGASFSDLAKKYSTDTQSAKKGGDLGYAPLSQYVTAFAQAAAKLTQVGQLSGIVHSEYGYHIIKLLGIKPASTQPLSSVSGEIKSYLQQQYASQAQQSYISKLRKKAKVKMSVPKTVPKS